MIKPGHIRIMIDQKVYFEPDGLEYPYKRKYWAHYDPYHPRRTGNHGEFYEKKHQKALKEYEASKQLIVASNVCWDTWLSKLYFISKCGTKPTVHIVKNNMPCKAEVIGDKATIVELTK